MSGTWARRVGPLAGAVLADLALGDPPDAWHPVAWFGRSMTAAERAWWSDRRLNGALHAAVGAGGAALVGRALGAGGPRRRALALAASAYVAVAGRGLVTAATGVAAALEAGDLDRARNRLRSLVGRTTDDLDEAGIVRATVESVAENTVDAVTAPLLWALAGGAPGILAYRAVNTLDAMVGHRSPRYARFGWASARADDVANWVPARVTAALVAALRPAQAAAVWDAVRHQAPEHPSPNAGVAEAAFAAALGVRLGGTNDYGGRIEHRPLLGRGRPPVRADIVRACRLSRQVGIALLAVPAAGSALRGRAW